MTKRACSFLDKCREKEYDYTHSVAYKHLLKNPLPTVDAWSVKGRMPHHTLSCF